MSSIRLPAPLCDLDEQQLPVAVREKVDHMVRLGHNRKHLMVGQDHNVYVDPELAMLHCDDEAEADE